MQLARWEPRCTRIGKLAANSNVERLNNWWIVAPTRGQSIILPRYVMSIPRKRSINVQVYKFCYNVQSYYMYFSHFEKYIFMFLLYFFFFFFIWIYFFLIFRLFRIFFYFECVDLEMNQFIINVMVEVIGQFPARSIEFPDRTQSINNFEW